MDPSSLYERRECHVVALSPRGGSQADHQCNGNGTACVRRVGTCLRLALDLTLTLTQHGAAALRGGQRGDAVGGGGLIQRGKARPGTHDARRAGPRARKCRRAGQCIGTAMARLLPMQFFFKNKGGGDQCGRNHTRFVRVRMCKCGLLAFIGPMG